jgi:glycosyltransferase involved in cell wall biosynthesis
MRILQICSAREIGGGERHLADLANNLANRGHEIFAAIAPGSPVRSELSSLTSENMIELPMRNALSVSSGLRLSRFVRERRIEIIHVLFPLSRIHRLTLRRTSRVIAVSGAVADGLRAQNIFPAGKIITIHNGVDLERFEHGRSGTGVLQVNRAQDARATRRMRVGMVGHLAPIKGQEEFIRAAASVCQARNDVDFIIAGEDKSRAGENRASIEKLILDLDLEDRVQLAGSMTWPVCWRLWISLFLPRYQSRSACRLLRRWLPACPSSLRHRKVRVKLSTGTNPAAWCQSGTSKLWRRQSTICSAMRMSEIVWRVTPGPPQTGSRFSEWLTGLSSYIVRYLRNPISRLGFWPKESRPTLLKSSASSQSDGCIDRTDREFSSAFQGRDRNRKPVTSR